MTVSDVLDPDVHVTITEDPAPALYVATLRAGLYHADFVVDQMQHVQKAHVDKYIPPIPVDEVDDLVTQYDMIWHEEPERHRIRDFFRWLFRRQVDDL
jgi:hypothetical protein